MSLCKGAISLTRFEATDVESRDAIYTGIGAHTFTPGPPRSEPRIGFTHLGNGFMDPVDYFYGDWVAVSVRVDQHKVCKQRLEAELQREVKAWCEQHQVDSCPRVTRKTIREAIEERLLLVTPPTTRVHQVAWCLRTNIVLLDTHAQGVTELVMNLWRKAFGVALTHWTLTRGLDEERREAVEGMIYALPNFMRWLWFATENEDTHLTIPPIQSVWIDNRIIMASADQGEQVVLKGENPAMTREARLCLAQRKLPREIRIGWSYDWGDTGSLSVREDGQICNLCLPTSRGEDEDALIEHLNTIEETVDLAVHWIGLWAEQGLCEEGQKKVEGWANQVPQETARRIRFNDAHDPTREDTHGIA